MGSDFYILKRIALPVCLHGIYCKSARFSFRLSLRLNDLIYFKTN